MKALKYMLRIILLPVSGIYAIIVYLRNRFFDWGWLSSKSFDIPVISIGNITVGGTGKTPMVEYLITTLKKEYRILYLSRGYKRKTKGFVMATNNSGIEEIGDEARQIKQKFPDIDVAVSEKRVDGINKALSDLSEKKPQLVILDDAFQHRYVKPGLSILLFDYFQPAYNDLILPSGRLRECFCERKRADLFVLTKSPDKLDENEKQKIENKIKYGGQQKLYFCGLKYSSLVPVFDKQMIDILSLEKESSSILLLTGIVNTIPIVNYLSTFTSDLKHIKYPDHHNFNKKDIYKVIEEYSRLLKTNKLIITTEKDATRLFSSNYSEELKELPVFYLPVEIKFTDDKEDNFHNQILSYVRSGIGSS
ncbi:tetraacyldisaccharide 4'-kinase [Bacteroidota bacterium]